jgi:cytochrome c-type biogenesis protein CcmH/NrfG
MIRWQGKADSEGALAAWQQLLKTNPQLSTDRKATVEKLMADVKAAPGKQRGIEGARSDDGNKSNSK